MPYSTDTDPLIPGIDSAHNDLLRAAMPRATGTQQPCGCAIEAGGRLLCRELPICPRKPRATEYRTGTLTHEVLGDVEVECPECQGEGSIELEWPQNLYRHRRDCDLCRGRGTVWREASDG